MAKKNINTEEKIAKFKTHCFGLLAAGEFVDCFLIIKTSNSALLWFPPDRQGCGCLVWAIYNVGGYYEDFATKESPLISKSRKSFRFDDRDFFINWGEGYIDGNLKARLKSLTSKKLKSLVTRKAKSIRCH